MTLAKPLSRTLTVTAVALALFACPPPGTPRLAHNAIVSCGASTDCNSPPPVGKRPQCATSGTCTNSICSFTFTAGTQCSPGDVAYCNPPGGLYPACDTSSPPNVTLCGTKQCVDGATCSWGACTPPACSPTCNGNVPVTCNSAGNPVQGSDCGTSATCVNGACQPNGPCSPTCTGNTPMTCDASGHLVAGAPCGGGTTCVNGTCQPVSQPTTQYCRDADGDTYCTSECQQASAAPGSDWRSNCAGQDCNDANAQVHPGQTQYFSAPASPSTGMSNPWDYDCDGTTEKSPDPAGLRQPSISCSHANICENICANFGRDNEQQCTNATGAYLCGTTDCGQKLVSVRCHWGPPLNTPNTCADVRGSCGGGTIDCR